MTYIKNKAMYLEQTPPAICTSCGKLDELRPYGKDGASICYECGMKDIETTRAEFKKLLDEVDYLVPPKIKDPKE